MIFRKQISLFSSEKLLLAWQNVCHMSYQIIVEKQQHEISKLMREEEEYITVSKERQGF